MDTEVQHVRLQPIKLSRSSSIITRENEAPAGDVPCRYTSLRDVILNSPPCSAANCYEGSDVFDPANITIRNQLVKHAASMYVQSAALIATRNQNWLVRLWEKAKNNVGGSRTCWYAYVWYPMRACFRPLYLSLEYMLENALNSVIRI